MTVPDDLVERVARGWAKKEGFDWSELNDDLRLHWRLDVNPILRALASLPDVRLVPAEATDGMAEAAVGYKCFGSTLAKIKLDYGKMLAHPDADPLAPWRK